MAKAWPAKRMARAHASGKSTDCSRGRAQPSRRGGLRAPARARKASGGQALARILRGRKHPHAPRACPSAQGATCVPPTAAGAGGGGGVRAELPGRGAGGAEDAAPSSDPASSRCRGAGAGRRARRARAAREQRRGRRARGPSRRVPAAGWGGARGLGGERCQRRAARGRRPVRSSHVASARAGGRGAPRVRRDGEGERAGRGERHLGRGDDHAAIGHAVRSHELATREHAPHGAVGGGHGRQAHAAGAAQRGAGDLRQRGVRKPPPAASAARAPAPGASLAAPAGVTAARGAAAWCS